MFEERMAGQRVLPWSVRAVFTVVALAAFALGLVGFKQYLQGQNVYGHEPVDLVYYSFQLFVLDASPLQSATNLPVPLEIARFAAPAVTVYLILLTVQEVFADRLMQARIRFSRDHSILCGPYDTVQQLADQIRREIGGKVVIVSSRARRTPRRGPLHVVGDPRQRHVLERAGLHRAREIIVVGSDSVLNAEVAIAVHAINREKGSAVTCYAEAQENELFEAFVGQEVGPREVNRLDTFNRHDRTARALLDHLPPSPPSDPRSAVVVIGYSGLGRALVDHLVQFWSGDVGAAEAVPHLHVLDPDAQVGAVLRRYADSPGQVIVSARQFDPAWLTTIDDLLVPGTDGTGSVPDRVYVCLNDDAAGIAVGDAALHLLANHKTTIIVAVPHSRVLGHAAGVTGLKGSGPPAARTIGAARLVLVNVVKTVYTIAAMRTGMNEQLAMAIHETYLAHMRGRSDTVETQDSAQPWDQLAEPFKDSNREQAWDIGRKLAMIGLSAIPTGGSNGLVTLSEEDVEKLAKAEHRRWMNERTSKGWRHGLLRDDNRKLHPNLVDWELLSEDTREKDRLAVRAIPQHLAKAGLQIIQTM
jgi:hypothetical protein